MSEIYPGRVCVVRTPNGLLLKHVCFEGGKVRLASSNADYSDLFFDANEIRVTALLVQVIKAFGDPS